MNFMQRKRRQASKVRPQQRRSRRPEKLVLRARVYPGDLLMLTSAIRDLHLAYPGHFITDVDTTCGQVWQHNPYIEPVDRNTTHRYIDMGYPPYSHDEMRPRHLTTRYHDRLSEELGIHIPVTERRPEIYLSEEETETDLLESLNFTRPYWVVIAGAKYDTTTKWWNPSYYQEVVDQLRTTIDFVQCGAASDWHLPLQNVTNLVGQTDIRKLIRVIYHADGVLCPVTFAMHLAAAVPTANNKPRSCVVLVGGRETPSLIQYPNHTLLSAIGQLGCCQRRGCWRYVCQKTHVRQRNESPCELPIQISESLKIPLCMQMITPVHVVEIILRGYPSRLVAVS
jgi:ADP-heptose:LPS heptosyltransferase